MFPYTQMLLIVCAVQGSASALKQSRMVMEDAGRSVAVDDTAAAAGVAFGERLAVARQIFGGRTGYNG